MDIRVKDSKGKTVCPQCHRHYTPVLSEINAEDNRLIQDIYPDAFPFEREQLLTGICSDVCWNKYLGVPRE